MPSFFIIESKVHSYLHVKRTSHMISFIAIVSTYYKIEILDL